MIVGGYSLHLYCDTEGCQNAQCSGTRDNPQVPGDFTHDTNQRGAVAKARRAGWKINLTDGTCRCPDCSKKKP